MGLTDLAIEFDCCIRFLAGSAAIGLRRKDLSEELDLELEANRDFT